MPLRYTPMLKTKAGEITSLDKLQTSTKARVYPVLHLTQTLAINYPQQLAAAWSNRPLAVDGNFSFNENGSVTDFVDLIDALRSRSVDARPCVSIGADPALIGASITRANKSGLVVKFNLNDIDKLSPFCIENSLSESLIDLILDVGHVAGLPISILSPIISKELNDLFLNHNFRSITLASAAAPKDFGSLPRGRSTIPRLDWRLWQDVKNKVNFDLHYGDYCTGHPDLTEPPGMVMARATVSARYSDQANWIVVKGHPTTGQSGQPMDTQYRGHAALLSQEATFGNLPGCWGDQQITAIVGGQRKSGNRKTWTEIAVNRHIEIVAAQLP